MADIEDNKTSKTSPIVFFGIGAIVALFIYAFVQFFQRPPVDPAQANESYRKGVEAKTVAEREEAFNNALNLYLQLDKAYHPVYGNGRLDFDIGNTYFQLGEYSWAVLYYYRALQLMPRSDRLKENLEVALSKLGLPHKNAEETFHNLLFFHYKLSLPERLQVFLGLSLLLIIFGSWMIWHPSRKLKYGIVILCFCWAVMLLALFYARYLSPLEGVVINPTMVYRDAGKQYAQARSEPLLAGMKIEVIDVLQSGRWYKIITPDGTLGYVPQTALQLIEEAEAS